MASCPCLSIHTYLRIILLRFSQYTTYVLGSLGGNLTQELSNLHLLYLYRHLRLIYLSESNCAFLLTPGVHRILTSWKGHCGLVPLGAPVAGVRTKGLRWNLDGHRLLSFGGLVSSSNFIEDNEILVEVSGPLLWTFDFREQPKQCGASSR